MRDRIYKFFLAYAQGRITGEIVYRVLDGVKAKPIVLVKARQALENLFTDGGIDIQRFHEVVEYIDLLRGNSAIERKSGSRTQTGRERTARESAPLIEGGRYKPAKGQVVGHYQLRRCLGVGGMGEVWLAYDLSLVCEQWETDLEASATGRSGRAGVGMDDEDGFVVIKFISEEFREHTDAWKVFKSEFRKYRKLNHPIIVQAFELNRIGDTGYIVMEYASGVSLRKIIEERPGGLSFRKVRQIMSRVCEGLEYAHKGRDLSRRGYSGVIHSDMKPSNILYDSRKDQVKIIDFGISQHLRGEDRLRTVMRGGINAVQALGALSESYASLEMFHDEDPDPADDVYGLACITYELLTGRHPYDGRSADMAAVAQAKKRLKLQPVEGLSRSSWEALKKGLAIYRNDRTATVAEFKRGVFEGKVAVVADRPGVAGREGFRLTWPRVAATGALGLFVIVGGWWFWESREGGAREKPVQEIRALVAEDREAQTSRPGQAGRAALNVAEDAGIGVEPSEVIAEDAPAQGSGLAAESEASAIEPCLSEEPLRRALSCVREALSRPAVRDGAHVARIEEQLLARIRKAVGRLSLDDTMATLEEAANWVGAMSKMGLGSQRELEALVDPVILLMDRKFLLEGVEVESQGVGDGMARATELLRVCGEHDSAWLEKMFQEPRLVAFVEDTLNSASNQLAQRYQPAFSDLLGGYEAVFAHVAPVRRRVEGVRAKVANPDGVSDEIPSLEALEARFLDQGRNCQDSQGLEETLAGLARSGVRQSTRVLADWCRRRINRAISETDRPAAERALLIWKKLAAEDNRYLKYEDKVRKITP